MPGEVSIQESHAKSHTASPACKAPATCKPAVLRGNKARLELMHPRGAAGAATSCGLPSATHTAAAACRLPQPRAQMLLRNDLYMTPHWYGFCRRRLVRIWWLGWGCHGLAEAPCHSHLCKSRAPS